MSKRRMVVDELSLAADVSGAWSLRGRLFVEVDALALVQLIEAAFHRAPVEEPLLPALVSDEPEAPIPDQSLDRAVRHVINLRGP